MPDSQTALPGTQKRIGDSKYLVGMLREADYEAVWLRSTSTSSPFRRRNRPRPIRHPIYQQRALRQGR